MAKVEVVNNERVILVEQKVIEQRVHLDMSMDEAKVLRFILDFIGGDPYESPRKFSDGIYGALCQNKIYPSDKCELITDHTLYFKDFEDL